jgi:hypothetical protein
MLRGVQRQAAKAGMFVELSGRHISAVILCAVAANRNDLDLLFILWSL